MLFTSRFGDDVTERLVAANRAILVITKFVFKTSSGTSRSCQFSETVLLTVGLPYIVSKAIPETRRSRHISGMVLLNAWLPGELSESFSKQSPKRVLHGTFRGWSS